MTPGHILHRLATLVCSPRSMERIVEPAIADLQAESRRQRQPSLRRIAAVCAGYIAVWKVIIVCLLTPERSSDERLAFSRMLRWTVIVTLVTAAPMIISALPSSPQSTMRRAFLVHLIPHSLPLALPAGLTFGVALGLAGIARSRQTARDVLMLALGAAALGLVVMSWLMPTANQSFRQAMFEEIGGRGVVMKGPSEMSFSELRREAASYQALGNLTRARDHWWTLHMRFALPAAAMTLPAFLFFISAGRTFSRGLVAFIVCFGYFVLLLASGSLAVRNATLGVVFAAWLPNMVFGVASVCLWRAR
jgi:hypothetical protein